MRTPNRWRRTSHLGQPSLGHLRSQPFAKVVSGFGLQPASGKLSPPLRLRRHGSRLAPHPAPQCDEHPTAEWTIQQFREFLDADHQYRFLNIDGIGFIVEAWKKSHSTSIPNSCRLTSGLRWTPWTFNRNPKPSLPENQTNLSPIQNQPPQSRSSTTHGLRPRERSQGCPPVRNNGPSSRSPNPQPPHSTCQHPN